jgi:hypothetical protein
VSIWNPYPGRGAEIQEAATPAGVADSFCPEPRGRFAPRANGYNASGVPKMHDHGLPLGEPTMTTFIQDVTGDSRSHLPTPEALLQVVAPPALSHPPPQPPEPSPLHDGPNCNAHPIGHQVRPIEDRPKHQMPQPG